MRIPDYLEPITAYRCFDVHPNGLLTGQAVGEPWPPFAPLQARCQSISDDVAAVAHVSGGRFSDAPVRECECGIHALRDLAAAERRIVDDEGWLYMRRALGRAWGRVALWGRIVEHTDGYRAEFAYPQELWCEDRELAPRIAALYGIPCGVKTLKRQKTGLAALTSLGGSASSNCYKASYAFWRSQVITSVSDDANDTPMVQTPKQTPRVVAPPSVVGANRWQTKQYAKTLTPPQVQLADWRQILKDGFHKAVSDAAR